MVALSFEISCVILLISFDIFSVDERSFLFAIFMNISIVFGVFKRFFIHIFNQDSNDLQCVPVNK